MAGNRPRGREKNVSGAGKGVYKRGSGLGIGSVGNSGGYSGRGGGPSGGGGRGTRGTRAGGGGGMMKIILLLVVLLMGGGGSIGSLLLGGNTATSGSSQTVGQSVSTDYSQYPQSTTGSIDLSSLFGSLGGGSVSTGWDNGNNTGKLNTAVADGAQIGRAHV